MENDDVLTSDDESELNYEDNDSQKMTKMTMLIFTRIAWMYPYMMTVKINKMMMTINHTVTDCITIFLSFFALGLESSNEENQDKQNITTKYYRKLCPETRLKNNCSSFIPHKWGLCYEARERYAVS